MHKGRRLDHLLVERGLAPSRERARSLILAGRISVEGTLADKAGSAYSTKAEIRVAEDPCPYVSRGGLKLVAALDAFGVMPEGRICLDVGASTGGFTDVLLQRGARAAICLDVGKGQLDWTLREDPRVTVLEGINARYLTPDSFARVAGEVLLDLATLDLSFISATKVLPAVGALLAENSEIILLAKPQFEAGKGQVGKGGIVRSSAVHRTVLENLWSWAAGNSFGPQAACASPILGAKGNREFFLYFRPGAEAREMETQVERALKEAN